MTHDDLVASMHDLWRAGVITGVGRLSPTVFSIMAKEGGTWIDMTHGEATAFLRGAYAMHGHLIRQVNQAAPLAAVDVWSG